MLSFTDAPHQQFSPYNPLLFYPLPHELPHHDAVRGGSGGRRGFVRLGVSAQRLTLRSLVVGTDQEQKKGLADDYDSAFVVVVAVRDYPDVW